MRKPDAWVDLVELAYLRYGKSAYVYPLDDPSMADEDVPLYALTPDEVALLDAVQAGTHRIVPREPTLQMAMAANEAFPTVGETTCSEIGRMIYRAMLAAAPPAPTGGERE